MDRPIFHSDAFLNALPVGVLLFDSSWLVSQCNNLALKLLGIHVSDLLDGDIESRVESGEFASCMAHMRAGAMPKQRAVFDLNGRRISCVAQELSHQDEIRVVVILEDATKVKEFEDLKHEFIEAILHRLKSPLSTLETTLGIVTSNRAGMIDPAIKQILDMGYQEVIRLHSLTRDLRDLFFIETGLMKNELEIEECGVDQAMDRALTDLEHGHAPFNTIRSRVRIEGETGSVVPADFDKLKQVLINVVKNAVQFSPDGNPVVMRVLDREGSVSIQVADKGIGISNENIGLVFDKFFREDNAVTRKVPGNGLGLFNAKALVELMGGVMYCESAAEAGSSFFVNFPSSRGGSCRVQEGD